jgi:inhibitor of KinA sporulation pathway (predicted exonuclease)
MSKKQNIKKDKLLIVDLEATCWRGRPPKGMYQEIIEIGIVCLDLNTGEISDEKGIITIPTKSKISWFCTELTTIDEDLIKKEGIHFNKACEILLKDYDSKNRIWASWDDFDKKQFSKDCKHKNVDYPFSDNHINLKPLFSQFTNDGKQYGVKSALAYLELNFEGCPHRGVDDAYNTARIVSNMLDLLKEKI